MSILPDYSYYIDSEERSVQDNCSISTAPDIKYQPRRAVARRKDAIYRHIPLNNGKSKEARGNTRENIRTLLYRKERESQINQHKRDGKQLREYATPQ